MKELILIGGGGHCKSVIDAAESAGEKVKGVLDRPELVGQTVLDTKIIGGDSDISRYAGECKFIVTVGSIKNCELRIKLTRMVEEAGGEMATVVASTAHVSKYAEVGKGSVILHHASVNASARIGEGCIINTSANIEHDAEVGDFTHVSTGAMVNGNCRIGARCFVGSGSVIANGVSVCDDVVIAAGAAVYKDITVPGVYAGMPARRALS